jgi:hypothetical protein
VQERPKRVGSGRSGQQHRHPLRMVEKLDENNCVINTFTFIYKYEGVVALGSSIQNLNITRDHELTPPKNPLLPLRMH